MTFAKLLRLTWPLFKKHGLVFFLMVIIAFQYLQIRSLNERLKNPLIAPKVEEAAKAGTPAAPVVVNVSPPGLPNITVPPAMVFTQPAVPSFNTQPAQPPRVVAVTEPAFCKTREECERILGVANQTITVLGFVRAGTVVPVLIDGKVVNAPLAEDYKFSLNLALSERGIFHAVLPIGGPLGVTAVTTKTVVVEPVVIEKRVQSKLPYNLAFTPVDVIVTNRGATVFSGVSYQNYAYGGVYSVGLGYGWPGLAVRASFSIPVR